MEPSVIFCFIPRPSVKALLQGPGMPGPRLRFYRPIVGWLRAGYVRPLRRILCFCFLQIKGYELAAAALVAAAEHLVELQTDALKTTIIMLAWTMTNAPTRKNEIVLDR